MNPLRLRAANYRRFEGLDLDLPTGGLAIVGDNGAGKSSIVNIIDLALFGPPSRTLADYLSDDGEGTELMIELEFEHAGEHYRVRRGYSARGRGKTTLDFERYNVMLDIATGEEEWVPSTREGAKETQALIEQTIGLTRETFRASAFLAQGDAAAFTNADPRDRKRILAQVLGLGIWDDLALLAKRDRRDRQLERERLDGATAAARELVAEKEGVETQLLALQVEEDSAQADLADAEQTLADITARWQAAQAAIAEHRAATAELDAAVAKVHAFEETKRRADEATGEIPRVQSDIERLELLAGQLDGLTKERAALDTLARERREKEAERDAYLRDAELAQREYDRLTAEHTALLANGKDLEAKAHALLAETTETCDRCGQELEAEARERARASFEQEARAVMGKAQAIFEQRGDIDDPTRLRELADAIELGQAVSADAYQALVAKETELRGAVYELGQARAKLGQLQTLWGAIDADFVASLYAAARAGEEATARLAAIEVIPEPERQQLQDDGLLARSTVAEQRALLDRARTEKARADAKLEQIADAERKIADAAARQAELDQELSVLTDLERAYGRDGIPLLITENIVPQLEVKANTYLQRLPCIELEGARIELQTQRANKTNENLRDVLDIVVHVESGAQRAYEMFSGGERARLDLVLRLALAELLATRRGAESKVLILDEPYGLDAQGKAALVEVLRDFQALGMERTYLVSQDPDLTLAFDQALRVSRDGAGRSLVDAGITEQVAA